MAVAGAADAQRPAEPGQRPHPRPAVTVCEYVFIGGYFYDPFFGPYPWWHRVAYPYWYFPVFDNRADVRLRIEPEATEEAAVYVDGFYAGIVDDFNRVFESLPLTPGGHRIELYLDGYRTARHNIYLSPGSTFTVRETMEKLPAGVRSEAPELAPPLPAPPEGTYRTPVTPPKPSSPTAPARATPATRFGTLELQVQMPDVEVEIDGQRWVSSDPGQFVVQLPVGRHRIALTKAGYFRMATDVDIKEGDTSALNVSLRTTAP